MNVRLIIYPLTNFHFWVDPLFKEVSFIFEGLLNRFTPKLKMKDIYVYPSPNSKKYWSFFGQILSLYFETSNITTCITVLWYVNCWNSHNLSKLFLKLKFLANTMCHNIINCFGWNNMNSIFYMFHPPLVQCSKKHLFSKNILFSIGSIHIFIIIIHPS